MITNMIRVSAIVVITFVVFKNIPGSPGIRTSVVIVVVAMMMITDSVILNILSSRYPCNHTDADLAGIWGI